MMTPGRGPFNDRLSPTPAAPERGNRVTEINPFDDKAAQRGAGWQRLFVDQKAEFRLVRQNGKAMDGWCGEITWPNGLVVELDVDRDEPNPWTMVTRCTSDPSREPKAFRGSWGNLVVESYELLQRWYATTI